MIILDEVSRGHGSVHKRIPVKAGEERMGLQVVVAPAQSSTRVAFVQQLGNQILGVLHEIVAVVFHEVREL